MYKCNVYKYKGREKTERNAIRKILKYNQTVFSRLRHE